MQLFVRLSVALKTIIIIATMPPKRNIKNNSVKPKSPALVKSTIGVDSQESTEAELKFDQEVLWSIAQFEKLINTGKLSEAKSKH